MEIYCYIAVIVSIFILIFMVLLLFTDYLKININNSKTLQFGFDLLLILLFTSIIIIMFGYVLEVIFKL